MAIRSIQPYIEIAKNTLKLLGLAWKMDKKMVFLYYATCAVGALTPVGTGLLLMVLIDQLQLAQQNNITTVSFLIVAVLASRYMVSFAGGIVYWIYNTSYLDYLFRYKLQNMVTLGFHNKVSSLDIAYFENPKTQDLITQTKDSMRWRIPDFLRSFSYLLRDVVAYVGAFIVLLPYGWWIPVVVTIITIPRLYLKAKYGIVQWSIWASGAPQARKLWYFDHILQDPIATREMRIFQSTDALMKKFGTIQENLYHLNKKPLDQYLKASAIPPFLEVIIIIGLAYYFLPPVLAGAMSIGTFTLIVGMLEELNDRASNASSVLGEIYENHLYLKQYFALLALPTLITSPENPVRFSHIKPPKIEFRNVSFNYPDGPPILKNVSFTLAPGESIAFVGENGAGKTTIIKLLCRFYDVTEGEILINDVNIKDIDLSHWYKFLGTLFQEFVHYHFSVRDNITLGAPDRNDETAMVNAAEKSGALEFIDKLPKKFDTMLGREFEDGEELSGGQWQKLAIARAFYENPPVLILDEPTSAIDAEAEYEIFNNLEKQYKNKTLILVSHRFSTVRNADRIIVISHGKIAESGSHEELIKKKGKYSRMFTVQAKGYA